MGRDGIAAKCVDQNDVVQRRRLGHLQLGISCDVMLGRGTVLEVGEQLLCDITIAGSSS